jgi:hypothetical protein
LFQVALLTILCHHKLRPTISKLCAEYYHDWKKERKKEKAVSAWRVYCGTFMFLCERSYLKWIKTFDVVWIPFAQVLLHHS